MPNKSFDKTPTAPTGSHYTPNHNKIQLALEVLKLPQQPETVEIRKQAAKVLEDALK